MSADSPAPPSAPVAAPETTIGCSPAETRARAGGACRTLAKSAIPYADAARAGLTAHLSREASADAAQVHYYQGCLEEGATAAVRGVGRWRIAAEAQSRRGYREPPRELHLTERVYFSDWPPE